MEDPTQGLVNMVPCPPVWEEGLSTLSSLKVSMMEILLAGSHDMLLLRLTTPFSQSLSLYRETRVTSYGTVEQLTSEDSC